MLKVLYVFVVLFYAGVSYGREGIIKAVQEAFELYSVGNFEEAAPLFDEAGQMMKENAPKDIEGRCKVALYAALSYREMADYQNAYVWFAEAYSLSKKKGDKTLTVKVLSYIAEAERMLSFYDKSIESYNKAIKSGLVEDKDKAALYYGLGETYRLTGRYDDAIMACGLSDEISKKMALDKIHFSCDIVEGEVYRMKGDYAKSLQIFGAAYDNSRARNYSDIAIAALNGMGLVSETLGRTDAARDRFEEALSLSFKNGSFDGIILISSKVLSLLPPKGSFESKGADMVEMAEQFEPIKDSDIKIALLKLATGYFFAAENYERMYLTNEIIYGEAVSGGIEEEAIKALYRMAEASYYMENYPQVAFRADEAIARAKSAKIKNVLGEIYALKAESFVKMGYFEDAVVIMAEAQNNADTLEKKESYGARLSVLEVLARGSKAESDKADEITTPEDLNYKPLNHDILIPDFVGDGASLG